MKNMSTVGDNLTLRDLPMQKLCDWLDKSHKMDPGLYWVWGTVPGPWGHTQKQRSVVPTELEGKDKTGNKLNLYLKRAMQNLNNNSNAFTRQDGIAKYIIRRKKSHHLSSVISFLGQNGSKLGTMIKNPLKNHNCSLLHLPPTLPIPPL